jgi:diamine N-acetyltransferase
MIEKIDESKLSFVQEIAKVTWPIAFGNILSKEQLAYMMDMMYRFEVLEAQLLEGHEFYLFNHEGIPVGFMGIEANYNEIQQLKIHKLYILPTYQGKKIGEQFIRFAEKRALELKQNLLTLNVNRYNKALNFYGKLGFKNVKTIDIEIGNGYLMEDYVMEKTLN